MVDCSVVYVCCFSLYFLISLKRVFVTYWWENRVVVFTFYLVYMFVGNGAVLGSKCIKDE